MKKASIQILQQQFSNFIKQGSINSNYEIENSIVDQLPISIHERLFVYKNAYKQRMHSSLEDDFPETFKVLKKEKFFDLVEEYLLKFPSIFWSLAEFSKNFPEFIARSKWGVEYHFLADLAQFEWIKNLAFFAEDPTPFDFTMISKISEKNHNNIVFKLNPSVFLFKSKWPLHFVGVKKIIPKKNCFYIVYRNKRMIFHENISKGFWDILMKISQGLNMGEIVESSIRMDEEKISKYFSEWVSKGIITHFIYNGEYI